MLHSCMFDGTAWLIIVPKVCHYRCTPIFTLYQVNRLGLRLDCFDGCIWYHLEENVSWQRCVLCCCDRTTSEMRGSSYRIQIGWFSTKQECSKHMYEAFKTIILLTIKLLHFSLKITRLRSRRCFKRKNKFVEAFNSTIKDIHLILEVKTFFGNSTPTTGLSLEFST
jgi:hypothetical protein